MRPYQIKFSQQGRQDIATKLVKGSPISAQSLIDKLSEAMKPRPAAPRMEYKIAHKDAQKEIIGMTGEKFHSADAVAAELAGNIIALVDFANASMAAGVRQK